MSEEHHGSLTVPLYQTSTFTFERQSKGNDVLREKKQEHIYSRLGNPTVHSFRRTYADLKMGQGALAFGSGMAAVSAC